VTDQIPLARPELGEREQELVREVIASGRLSLGPMLERFEQQFAAWLGVGDAVAVSSGTTALHLGVRGFGWGEGDEVVTSPFSFVASANCLLYEGVRPVFADIDPETLNLDPDAAAAAVGEHTVGLLPIHIFGRAAAMGQLQELAREKSLGLLEDACEALGGVDSGGVAVGARGNPATFAFYANKQMTTGEGGMIVPPDADSAARYRAERNQGRGADMAWLEHERLGFNYRLSEIACALGVAQLERLDSMLEGRRRVAGWYREGLGGVEGLALPAEGAEPERHGWFVYVVQLPEGTERDGVIASLAEQGVASKAYLPCIHLFPHIQELGWKQGQFPVAESVAKRSLALPFFPAMEESVVDRVANALGSAM
jgi:dTDP-4-amino-4,6-dideoxygalactose transaminase